MFDTYIPITRAYMSSDNRMMIEGVASSDSIDSHRTIFSKECQAKWLEEINNNRKQVVMELNHDGRWDFTKKIGVVREAKVYKNPEREDIQNFHIIAELNNKNISAQEAFRIINTPREDFGEPKQLGFSVNGIVRKSHREVINGEEIEIFDEVELRMIGIVEYPSNPDSFNVSILRSIKTIDDNIKRGIGMSEEKQGNEGILASLKELFTNLANDVKREKQENEAVKVERDLKQLKEKINSLNEGLQDTLSKLENIQDMNMSDLGTMIRTLVDKCCYEMYSEAYNETSQMRSLLDTFDKRVKETTGELEVLRQEKDKIKDIEEAVSLEDLQERLARNKLNNSIKIINEVLTKHNGEQGMKTVELKEQKKEFEKLTRELEKKVEMLEKEVKRLSTQPTSLPSVDNTQPEGEISLEAILELNRQGKLDKEAQEALKNSLSKFIFEGFKKRG